MKITNLVSLFLLATETWINAEFVGVFPQSDTRNLIINDALSSEDGNLIICGTDYTGSGTGVFVALVSVFSGEYLWYKSFMEYPLHYFPDPLCSQDIISKRIFVVISYIDAAYGGESFVALSLDPNAGDIIQTINIPFPTAASPTTNQKWLTASPRGILFGAYSFVSYFDHDWNLQWCYQGYTAAETSTGVLLSTSSQQGEIFLINNGSTDLVNVTQMLIYQILETQNGDIIYVGLAFTSLYVQISRVSATGNLIFSETLDTRRFEQMSINVVEQSTGDLLIMIGFQILSQFSQLFHLSATGNILNSFQIQYQMLSFWFQSDILVLSLIYGDNINSGVYQIPINDSFTDPCHLLTPIKNPFVAPASSPYVRKPIRTTSLIPAAVKLETIDYSVEYIATPINLNVTCIL
jgi:hypothetical protein